jgi:hypothetical protein
MGDLQLGTGRGTATDGAGDLADTAGPNRAGGSVGLAGRARNVESGHDRIGDLRLDVAAEHLAQPFGEVLVLGGELWDPLAPETVAEGQGPSVREPHEPASWIVGGKD